MSKHRKTRNTKCISPKIPKYGLWGQVKYQPINNESTIPEWQQERGTRCGNNRKMWSRMKWRNRKRERQQSKQQTGE